MTDMYIKNLHIHQEYGIKELQSSHTGLLNGVLALGLLACEHAKIEISHSDLKGEEKGKGFNIDFSLSFYNSKISMDFLFIQFVIYDNDANNHTIRNCVVARHFRNLVFELQRSGYNFDFSVKEKAIIHNIKKT